MVLRRGETGNGWIPYHQRDDAQFKNSESNSEPSAFGELDFKNHQNFIKNSNVEFSKILFQKFYLSISSIAQNDLEVRISKCP